MSSVFDSHLSDMLDDQFGAPPRVAFVHCATTAGPMSFKFIENWSPNGFDRAFKLFERGFYDGSHFFRVVPNFLVQFGISYSNDTELTHFADSSIQDDPQLEPPIKFEEGVISFAGSGISSRTSHLFISYGSSPGLGTEVWETPIGTVIEGIENVKKLYSGYGDMPPWGHGPQQGKIRQLGEDYIQLEFPLLDKFINCLATDIDLEDGVVDVTLEEQNHILAILKQSVKDFNPRKRATLLFDMNDQVDIYMKQRKKSTVKKDFDEEQIMPLNMNSKNNKVRGSKYVTDASQKEVLTFVQRVQFPILASILLFGIIQYFLTRYHSRKITGKKS